MPSTTRRTLLGISLGRAKDDTVPLRYTQDMVDAIRAAGGNPRFTIYPEAGHDSWTEAYANDVLYAWLLEQHT